ncbi:hypothetical protein O203_23245 [Ectopseudomonas chengduensis]|nr:MULTISPECIES: hypothetical protein [Pseudomonas]AQZ32594.1 hypothetical protein BHQ29_04430 [Pseudomonas sp. LPH1]ERH51636.1 hypothetical protein O203_23245 [Pseudomonas chengduensis]
MKLGDAMGTLRSTSDQTHKFWAYFQAFTAGGITLAWSTTTQVAIVLGLVAGYAVFAHFNRLLVVSSQTDARKIWDSIQAYVAEVPAEVPEQLKEVPKTNEPQDPKRVKWLHVSITLLAALVMLARIPFLLWK